MPASPANALHAIGVVAGIGTLSTGFPWNSETFGFSGVATGVINGNTAILTSTTSSCSFLGGPDPLFGEGSCSISIAGVGSSTVSFDRVGLVATVQAYGSTFAAVSVPVGTTQVAVVMVGGVDL